MVTVPTLKPLQKCSGPLIDVTKKQRIVIIGTGPTGLGAARRLYELGILNGNTQVVILEKEANAGGLATSMLDKKGFLWDMGGHVVFSHYKYFDKTLDNAIPLWNTLKRAAFAFMKDSDDVRKFIPYPVQHNIHVMAKKNRDKSLKGLEEITRHPIRAKPKNFDEWLLKNFGKGLCEVFMRRYNKKVWTVEAKRMNAVWVGERVAVPDVKKIKAKIAETEKGGIQKDKDSSWGPNRFFRFPREGGTGGIWKSVANGIPNSWIHYRHKVTKINFTGKVLHVQVDDNKDLSYDLNYDTLITTAPLDELVGMASDFDEKAQDMKKIAKKFIYSHTHVIGIGLKGQANPNLVDKCWIYFPDADSPFYRVTLFSKYSKYHVPSGGPYWSLMCEAAEPLGANPAQWTEEYLLRFTIEALVKYGFIKEHQIVSRFHHRLEHGYPVPFNERDDYLSKIQPWLQLNGVYSRGRFGGWRYEVGNQDHSLMQGVEVADLVARNIPEETYPTPNLVNSMKASPRTLPCTPEISPDYEIVVSHFSENLNWLSPHADRCHIYHKGVRELPQFKFRHWKNLPNLGRAAHSFLYHIVKNYNHLANITVFLEASEIEPSNKFCYSDVMEFVKQARSSHFSVKSHYQKANEWGKIDHPKQVGDKIKKVSNTMAEMWEALYNHRHPEFYNSPRSNCFAVSRHHILNHSQEFYEKCLSYVNSHEFPETVLYFERLWEALFTVFEER